jgi:predicted amidohydrolase YtcJ
MDPAIGVAEAIAVTGNLITAVGELPDIERYIGATTEVIDLDGQMVGPGFVDPHTHILTDFGEFAAAQQTALSFGITSLGDASIEEGLPEAFIERAESGELRIRMSMYLAITDPCGTPAGDWYQAYEPGRVAPRLSVAGVKIFTDGGVCGLLAASEPWAPGATIGPPYHSDDQMVAWVADANERGFQVVMHAQGDLAIIQALDTYETVLAGAPNVLRNRIDHNVFVTPEMATRYGEIGIVPVVFGGSAACVEGVDWGPLFRDFGDRPNAIGLANPGLVVAWHGDDPAVPPLGAVHDLFSLVARSRVGDDGEVCEAPEWMRTGGVPIDEAMRMMTINAAYALGIEDRVGSLTPGKLADLVVLTDNVLEIPTPAILDVGVVATIIDGATEYCAPASFDYCPGFDPPNVDVSASAQRSGYGPELAFDGVAAGESFWSSGMDAPGWIQRSFGEPVTIAEARFIVFQNPPSETLHELGLLIDGTWTVVETFAGFTSSGDTLVWRPGAPVDNVSGLRMTTLESESWPEWYEIEIDIVE